MKLSILDLKDEFQLLKKFILEKKLRTEIIIREKKQLLDHIDLKYRDYNASIEKVKIEVNAKLEESDKYANGMEEIVTYYQKLLLYNAKTTCNWVAKAERKPLPYSQRHLNDLNTEIEELARRQKNILEFNVNIEPVKQQIERIEWVDEAIKKIYNLKVILKTTNKKEIWFISVYKLIEVFCIVLSIYGVFSLVEIFKIKIPINEFILNLIAGIIVIMTIDKITGKIKEIIFQKYLERSLSTFSKLLHEMQNVDKFLADFNL